MPRPQFSLKTMLWFMAAICVIFGGAHLVKKYGSFVEVRPVKAGEPFVLHGRVIRFFGPDRLHFCLDVFGTPPEWKSGTCCLYTCYGFAERSGPFTYRINSEFHLQAAPGEYGLKLVEGYHPDEPTVFGRLLLENP
jgi:hypothetical protein